MNDEEETDELQKIEDEIKKLEGMGAGDYGVPEQQKKDNLFRFFKSVLDSPDSRKVANLDAQDLARVRAYLEVGQYCDAEGLDKVALYLRKKAEITLATSMSKKGFWAQLLVTQIKKEQKMAMPSDKAKKKWWGGGKKEESEST